MCHYRRLHTKGFSYLFATSEFAGNSSSLCDNGYTPETHAPRFELFLKEIFEGDADGEIKAQVLLEMMGYTFLSHCKYEKFIILVGNGANGKSVLLSVLTALIGAAFVSAVTPSQFGNRFQLAHLAGKMANIVTEISEGSDIEDGRLKAIVSGEVITAEHKHKPPFEFRPYATCWFGTNRYRLRRNKIHHRATCATYAPKTFMKGKEKCKTHLIIQAKNRENSPLANLATLLAAQKEAATAPRLPCSHYWKAKARSYEEMLFLHKSKAKPLPPLSLNPASVPSDFKQQVIDAIHRHKNSDLMDVMDVMLTHYREAEAVQPA